MAAAQCPGVPRPTAIAMNPASDLFLLLLNLSQMRSQRSIMELFVESLGDLFAPATFQLVDQEPPAGGPGFPIATRTSAFGYLVPTTAEPLTDENQTLLHNAIQMLAVVLERLAFDQQLQTDKAAIEHLATDRLHELEAAMIELHRSRNASINLIEDLNHEIDEHKQAEVALRHSEGKLRNVIDSCPVPLAVNDDQGNITYVNREFTKTFGYVLGDIPTLAVWWQKAYPDPTYQAEVRTQWQQRLYQAIREGKEVETAEVTIRCQDGSQRIAQVGTTPLTGPDVGTHLVLLHDITARKQAEEALRHSEERLQLVMRGSQLGYWDWNLETGQVVRNARWAEMLGYDLNELEFTVKQWADFVHPDDLAQADQSIRDHVDGLTPMHRFEYRMRTKDGTYKWILDQAQVVNRDATGRALRMSGTHTDVTERRQAEDAVKQEQVLTKAIIDSIPGAFYMLDEAGGYVRWNTYQRDELVGQPEERVAGMNAAETIHPEDRALVQSKITNVLTQGGAEAVEGRVLLRGGPAYRWLLMTGQRIMIGGRPFLVGIGIDLSERKRAEAEVLLLNQTLEARVVERTSQLAAANAELEAFSYSVSHDLRAPLRALDGFSAALMEDCSDRLDEASLDHLRRVRAGSQRMAVLIDDLLNLSRETRAEIRREQVDVTALASEIGADLQRAQPDHRPEWSVASGLTANADMRMLRVVLTNLLGNAWKFTQRGAGAKIEVGVLAGEEVMDKLPTGLVEPVGTVFYVRDNGAGFDMAYAGKLFGAFQRLHSQQEFEGTGIGLALAQRIIRRHGGHVWAEGKVDEGATFYFTLGPNRS
jgi:PAS domain S-box-containing protein